MRSNIKTLISAVATVIALSATTQASTVSPTETLPANLKLSEVQGSEARLFAEKSNVTVGQGDVEVDYLASSLIHGDVYYGVTDFVPNSGIELGAGTYDSFLIHFDPFTADSTSGSFTFANSIVAIILSNGTGNTGEFSRSGLLNVSDGTFGGDSTTYESHVGRRAEGKASGRTGDTFSLVSANTISFTLTTNDTHIDNIRVITQVAPVPLPAGGLLLIAGLGALALQRRRAA